MLVHFLEISFKRQVVCKFDMKEPHLLFLIYSVFCLTEFKLHNSAGTTVLYFPIDEVSTLSNRSNSQFMQIRSYFSLVSAN